MADRAALEPRQEHLPTAFAVVNWARARVDHESCPHPCSGFSHLTPQMTHSLGGPCFLPTLPSSRNSPAKAQLGKSPSRTHAATNWLGVRPESAAWDLSFLAVTSSTNSVTLTSLPIVAPFASSQRIVKLVTTQVFVGVEFFAGGRGGVCA